MKPFTNAGFLISTCTVDGGPFTGRTKEAAILIEAALILSNDLHQILGLGHSGGPNDTQTEADESESPMQPLNISEPAQIRASWDQGNDVETSAEPETFALPLLYLESPENPSTIMTSLLIQKTLVTIVNDQVEDPRYGQVCYKRVGIAEVHFKRQDFETEDEYVQLDYARKEYVDALVKRVEYLKTHVVTLI
ncbi:hypothetical protein G6514_005944 [Epicoccum nigrum]|nr:hypothetical protein G6514_005944 [Epicoccum nigrum]